jgi:hypothetical protein
MSKNIMNKIKQNLNNQQLREKLLSTAIRTFNTHIRYFIRDNYHEIDKFCLKKYAITFELFRDQFIESSIE